MQHENNEKLTDLLQVEMHAQDRQANSQLVSQPACQPNSQSPRCIEAGTQPHAIPVIISVNNHITNGEAAARMLILFCLALLRQQSKPKLSKLSLSKGHRKRLASWSMGLDTRTYFACQELTAIISTAQQRQLFDNSHHDLRRFRYVANRALFKTGKTVKKLAHFIWTLDDIYQKAC